MPVDACWSAGFWDEFGQSTFENWQSEFLQLAAFTIATAYLVYAGSSESPDSEERLEAKLDVLLEQSGVDPKDVAVSWMDNVLTVKGERKAGPDSADKDYFVREVAYGGFERSFALPEGVDGAQVEAKYANGMLVVRIPAPRAAVPRMIEVKAA